EEMRGIADGSGQNEESIALLNGRYELAFTLFGQEARSEGVAELAEVAPDGCTTFGLPPEVTADRHTWLGQNWDWLEGVHGRTFVLRHGVKRNRASCASLRPGSPAEKWASTNAAGSRRKRPRLEQRWPQSVPKSVSRALPGGAGCGVLRGCGAAGDGYASHLLG